MKSDEFGRGEGLTEVSNVVVHVEYCCGEQHHQLYEGYEWCCVWNGGYCVV